MEMMSSEQNPISALHDIQSLRMAFDKDSLKLGDSLLAWVMHLKRAAYDPGDCKQIEAK